MTTLQKLHRIEKEKVIYNIHYCRAGVGFVFHYPEKQSSPDDWKSGLSVEKYYPTFIKAVNAEYRNLFL